MLISNFTEFSHFLLLLDLMNFLLFYKITEIAIFLSSEETKIMVKDISSENFFEVFLLQ